MQTSLHASLVNQASSRALPVLWLVGPVFVIFPFVHTVTGLGIYVFEIQVWKMMSFIWACALFVIVIHQSAVCFRTMSRHELWVHAFLLLMLAWLAVDGQLERLRYVFFVVVSIILVRALLILRRDDAYLLAYFITVIWLSYVIFLILYAWHMGNYPGANQHAFFLTGILGFLAGLRVMLGIAGDKPRPKSKTPTYIDIGFLLLTLVNLVLDIALLRSRSVLPFSAALLLVGLAWLSCKNVTPRKSSVTGSVLLALLLSMLPVAHLSGALGNVLYDITDPIVRKTRNIQSPTGREVAFRRFGEQLLSHGRLFGPPEMPPPSITNVKGASEQTTEQRAGYENMKRYQKRAQEPIFFVGRRPEIGPANPKNLAITSSHNLWIDAGLRFGWVYVALVLVSFIFVLYNLINWISPLLPWPVTAFLWLTLVGWGIAIQLDDEHWFYGIPYMSMIFLSLTAAGCAARQEGRTVGDDYVRRLVSR